MDYEKKYKQLHKFINDLYPHMSEYCKEKVVGFFPELKESEDERIRKEIIEFVDTNTLSIDERHHRWIAWLEKQGEQTHAWNGEDEAGFGYALWAIEQARSLVKDENDMGNLWYAENWLKSLKQKIRWKPSDEQMKALHDLNLTGDISYAGQGQLLIELYNDLKKLK